MFCSVTNEFVCLFLHSYEQFVRTKEKNFLNKNIIWLYFLKLRDVIDW